MTEKPRSAKQQAHARKIADATYAAAAQKIDVGPPRESGVPHESWWLNQSREGFSAKAREEITRMVNSRFARVNDPTYREQ